MVVNASCFIRLAQAEDADNVASILTEAADWLIQSGMGMWRADELLPERIEADVLAGLFYLAECGGAPAGVVKFQLEDRLFWPDVPSGDAAYVHRLAVKRTYSGSGVSTALLGFTAQHARKLGRKFLRLDCEASRPKLRAVYEKIGFRHHSDREVPPYFVSRYELALD